MKSSRIATPVVAAAFLWLAGIANGACQTNSALLTSTAPNRHQRLEEAAKAERTMTLYTSIAQNDLQQIIRPFEQKYGIRVTVWRASGDSVLQRVMQEQKAGRATVDAIHTSAPELEALSREGVLQPVTSPEFANLLPGSVPSHRNWASTLLSVWVQAYNTNLVKKADLPKTYEDLLEPKWKGKLGYEVENIDWFSTVVRSMGEERGLRFFRQLVAENGLSIRKGHSLLNTLVIAGEVPLALTLYNYMPAQAKSQGAPIDWFALEPVVARANGVAVVKNAKSPNAAALFEDYMLSEAQSILVSLNYVPTSKKAQSPLANIGVVIADPADKLDNAAKWEPLYQQIILRSRPK
ncbi:MAG: extracellular solute-binding protein [Proteobacteria bacterium]|nr:extracellular solute-binding protein [Pseudomonadota bacterium]MBI3498604.1 extracellular solute-binding protein [Pseudomonadota bacterium]